MLNFRVAGPVATGRIPFRNTGSPPFGIPARGRGALILLAVLLSGLALPHAPAHASDGMIWEAELTVGNVLLWPNNNERFPLPGEPGDGEGYENERGFRRAHCIGEFIDYNRALTEEGQSNYDFCYGSLSERTFEVDGRTYWLQGIFLFLHDGEAHTLEIEFTKWTDFTPLGDLEFIVDGVTFRVADRAYPGGRGGRYMQWGSDLVWTVSDENRVGEPAPPGSIVRVQLREPLAQSVEAPALSVADVTVTEGTDAAAEFTVTLDRAATEQVTVDYATSDGTATAGDDYTATDGTLTFAAGETSKTVSVPIVDDSVEDGGETFTLTLSNPTGGAALARATATGTIDNDDTGGAPLTASLAEVPASHGGGAFTVELSFSEAFAVSYLTMRDHAFQVAGGRVTGARRSDNPHHEANGMEPNRVWRITVEPDEGADAVSLTLSATTDCDAAGAICTADNRPLSAAVTASVPRDPPSETPATPFTVRFENVPAEHDGAAQVTFRVVFSRKPDPGYSYRTMRDETLVVRQGAQSLDAARAKRLNKPHNDRWEIAIDPVSKEDLAVSIAATSDCEAAGAVCSEGGEALSNAVSATIPGPPGLAVADARADENADAALDFAVTLGRASTATITVDYATSDGTASAGADYTATRGTLTFAPGETAKTVSVPILQDAHDEGEETLTLTLSNPTGGNAWLKDATATGTIGNTDPMPQAWLARFGRTVAEQVIDAVEGRFQASRAASIAVTLAGERIDFSGAGAGPKTVEEHEAHARLAAMTDWRAGAETRDGGRRAGYRWRAVTPRELLTGSSFALTGEAKAGGAVSLWGRGAVSRFDGRERTPGVDLTLDGEVASAMLGADWSRERWTAGLMVSRAVGEGGYRDPDGSGAVESTLTGLFPYGRYAASDRLTLWGIAGGGAGELVLTPEGQSPMRADMDLMMGAVGLRGVAVEAPEDGGVELAVKTDALAVRTTSERTHGLEAAAADATRLRLALEGSWRGLTVGTGTLMPTAEIGLRHDGGDAETGFGLDLGGGLSWSDPESGLSAELRGRGLLTHESEGFRDRGLSGAFAWAPGREGRGPSLTLTQTMGAAAAGGADALLGRRHLGGLAADDDGTGGGALADRRLELRLGYGFSVLADRFTLTPEAALGLASGRREYALGWRLGLAPGSGSGAGRGGAGALEVSFEATRRETTGANDNAAPQHGAGFRVSARW